MLAQLQTKVTDVTLKLSAEFTQVEVQDPFPFKSHIDPVVNEIDGYDNGKGAKVMVYHTYGILLPQQLATINFEDYLADDTKQKIKETNYSTQVINLQTYNLYEFTLDNTCHLLAITSFKSRALLFDISFPKNEANVWRAKAESLVQSITIPSKLNEFYQFVQVHPKVKTYVEQGYTLSLPFPMHQKRPNYNKFEMVFFLYKKHRVGEATYKLTLPEFFVTMNFSNFKTGKFLKAKLSKFGLKETHLQAFENHTFTEPSKEAVGLFFELYINILSLYFAHKNSLTNEEKSEVQKFRELLFSKHLAQPIQPYFKGINPYFVKWLYEV